MSLCSAISHYDAHPFYDSLFHFRAPVSAVTGQHVVALFSFVLPYASVWALAPPALNGLARYFALAVVNIVAARMVLNLKSFAASRQRAMTPDTEARIPSFAFIPFSPRPLSPPVHFLGIGRSNSSMITTPLSSFDLEMIAIEREYQQLGTKLR